jgi:acyl-CoA synthetase (AMP-forming)/AMP-acid ligase II/acyl carrier protein
MDTLRSMAVQALTDVLLGRAEQRPEAVAYESIDRAGEVSALSYAQLASRASALAAQLAGCGDGPVLLTYPAGLDYPIAVFAAFLAGRPVIPAYPPDPSPAHRTRLAGIVADARPPVVVAPRRDPGLPVPAVLGVPGPEADGAGWAPPRGGTGPDVAIIQYTSGSTNRPSGVLVRHDSLAANTAAIAARFRLTAACRGVSWLPPFHDMGLVGGLLTPMTAGIPVRILQPGDFLKAPLWWLRQVTESGATVSGGPNFAYDLCVRRARTDGELAGLDLSRWRVAFNGGEPVRHRTLAEFARRFAPAGFRPESLVPCYGLAEATLMVSAGHWTGKTRGAAVSCGPPVAQQRVVVVDPERRAPAAAGEEGEIWVAGPHVTSGYLSGGTAELFGELGGARFLRTGDLGYLDRGELFVTGRAKDVMVFRGANFHAEDVEAAALDAAGAAARTAAAFQVDTGAEPLPVLVLEMRGEPDESQARLVRAAVLARTGLPLGVVVLVPPRTVPRTSSGKVRRGACRDAFLAGAFDDRVASDPAPVQALAQRRARTAAASELAAMICGIVAGVCDANQCKPIDSLAALGMDSVRAAEAAAVLEDAVGLTVPLEAVLAAPTPQGVADTLVAHWLAAGCAAGLVRDRLAMAGNGVGDM